MSSTNTPSPYDYVDLVDFLQDTYTHIKVLRPRYSLRSWSIKLGFRSSASLSRILSRNRRTTLAQVRTISKGLNLSEHESLYLETIVQFDGPLMAALGPQLKVLFNKKKRAEHIQQSLKTFTMISEWYYSVILASLDLKRTFETAEDFAEVIADESLTLRQINQALTDLQKLGFIVPENGAYRKSEPAKGTHIEPGTASVAVRNFHSQMLGMALKSIHTVEREHRDIRGVTLAIKKEDYATAQAIISDAFEQIFALAGKGHGEKVYHLSTAFFPVSK